VGQPLELAGQRSRGESRATHDFTTVEGLFGLQKKHAEHAATIGGCLIAARPLASLHFRPHGHFGRAL